MFNLPTPIKSGPKKLNNQKGAIPLLLLIAVIGIIGFLGFSSLAPFKDRLFSNIFSKPASYAANLPIPVNLKIEEDDKNAILNWDDYNTKGNNKPTGVSGWVVYWGEVNGLTQSLSNPARKLTEDKIIQIQPLIDGKTYGAYVQSVDNFGNFSPPSSTITFKSNPQRVNTLRTQMNGFFDDFNLAAGAFDELKWNNAYSKCAGPSTVSGQFINAQTHAHNQIYDTNCDRGQNVSRPRAVFDFTPGTSRPNGDSQYGTITFDMDGSVGRDSWYLDIYDIANGILDVPSRASASDSPTEPAQSPFNNIRIRSASFTPSIFKVDEKGVLHNTIKTPGVSIPGCCSPILTTVKNVRNHWVIKVSPSRIIITINGVLAADVSGWIDGAGVSHTNGLEIPFNKSYMLWTNFSYNTAKANMPSSLLHWDNFGFDGPTGTTQTTVTHNYTDGKVSTSNPATNNGCATSVCSAAWNKTVGSDVIKIPDAVNGASSQRLMFTNVPHQYGWSAVYDYILFNGVKYPVPDVKDLVQNRPLSTPMRLVDDITPGNIVIPVTNAKTGDNTIEFHLTAGNLMNVHLELDFPKGSAPVYTQPTTVWGTNPIPAFTGAGITEIPNTAGLGRVIGKDIQGNVTQYQVWNFPNYTLQADGSGKEPAANSTCEWCAHTPIQMSPFQPIPQSGSIDLSFVSGGRTALAGSGSYPGHQSYQFFIDRQKVFDQKTDASVPSPSLTGSYKWDTTKSCNGWHQVFIVTYTPSGLASQAGYFQLSIVKPGYYLPINIYTNNPGQTPCVNNRVYVGIGIYSDLNGYSWLSGDGFVGGTTLYNGSNATPGLKEPRVYGSGRVGDSAYTFNNLPNGSYEVTLKFAENNYLKKKGGRVFNVSLNDQPVLTNFDILAEVALWTPLDKKFTVNVTGGTIIAKFISVVDQAIISGIQVLPTGTVLSPLTFSPAPLPSTTPQPSDDTGHTMPSSSPTSIPSMSPSPSAAASPSITPSPSPSPVPSVGKTGDVNGDGQVNVTDLSFILSKWNTNNVIADLNKDGRVNVTDLSILLSFWGK